MISSSLNTFEMILSDEFRRIGPVVALQNTQLPHRPLAHTEIVYIEKWESWEKAVDEFIDKAAVIAFIVAETPSLRQELTWVREEHAMSRALFVLPPVEDAAKRLRLKWLEDTLKITKSRNIAVGNGSNGSPIVGGVEDDQSGALRFYFYTHENSQWGYYKALKRCVRDLTTARNGNMNHRDRTRVAIASGSGA